MAGGVWNNPSFPEIQDFSRPSMSNNIFWQNRSFHFQVTLDGSGYELVPDGYDDLGVIGVPAGPVPCMNPANSILTDLFEDLPTCDYDANGNMSADPVFVLGYHNIFEPIAAATDEGGNFLDIRYGPLLAASGDYHIADTSPAIGMGDASVLAGELFTDIDGDDRPSAGSIAPDIGADENALAVPAEQLF
jgi:hypothetical protein